jgi:formylglycine-generating enzyme required for sulfatase activity
MSSDQDQTPGEESQAIHDLIGNAMEWTADLYREDAPDQDETWVQADGMTFRAVRGLPVAVRANGALPAEGAAYRDSLCATGPCPPQTAKELEHIGFRCVRRAKAKEGGR